MSAGRALVLASRSAIRQQLLRTAGLSFVVDAADLDEAALANAYPDPIARASALARAKALAVAARHPGELVLGADQVGVDADGGFLEKPTDPPDHVALLMRLQGRSHRFFPAAVLVRDTTVLAEITDTVVVTFRAFSQGTAAAYVATGEGAGSCGGYESENRAAQLIARIDGSSHSVLGLPLLPVLEALRRHAPDLEGLLPT